MAEMEYRKRLAKSIAVNHATPRLKNRLKLMGSNVKDADKSAKWAEETFTSTYGLCRIDICGIVYWPEFKSKIKIGYSK